MLHVLVLRIPARGQGCVHVTRVSIPRGMHRRACVARVGCGHLWPSGGDWGRMQSGSTAHQTGFHPGSGAIERVLVEEKEIPQVKISLEVAYTQYGSCSQFRLNFLRCYEWKLIGRNQ